MSTVHATSIDPRAHDMPLGKTEQPREVGSQLVHKPTIFERAVRTVETKRINWTTKAIRCLDEMEVVLDTRFSDLSLQKKVDALGHAIEKKFAPLRKFNAWLNSNGHGTWYKKLAIFLVKLPMRAARNILQMLYQIVKGIVYFAVHPVKSLLHLAKLTVRLLSELLKPETWSLIGAGMIASSCGFSLVTCTPFPLLGVAIGGALLLGSVPLGAFKTDLLAENGKKLQALKDNLCSQARKLPEIALSGFLMGILIGGIQQSAETLAHCRERELSEWFSWKEQEVLLGGD